MGSHQFDKHIKDKLQFHKMEVPQGMWEKIEAGLPDENKSRGLPFAGIISLCFLVTICFITGLYIFQTSDNALVIKGEKQVNRSYEQTGNKTRLSKLTHKPLQDKLSSLTLNPFKTTDSGHDQTRDVYQKNQSAVIPASIVQQGSFPASSTEESTLTPFAYLPAEKLMDKSVHLQNVAGISLLNGVQKYVLSTGDWKKSLPKDECLSDFDKSGKGIFLDFYYGNDLPVRHLKARDNRYDKLVKARKESETPLYSYSLGARLGFNLSKNFSLLTGVHFSQINEKFEFVDPESSQTKVVKTTLYIKDSQGNIKDSTFTYDTIFIPGTLVYKIRNQYTTFDLPFLVGYRLIQNDKVSLSMNVGIMANLVFRQEGMALVDDQYTVKSLHNGNKETFHHSLGFSTFASAQFLYRLTPHVNFFLEPSLRFQHRDMTTKDYPISQNYTTISFLTGARYNF